MSTLQNLSGTYTLDTSHTEIGFAARHAMVTKVRGAFTDFDGTAVTGPNLEGARINVNIQAASVDTGNGDRDGHLRSGDFFDVENYPLITFTSTEITNPEEETLRVAGDLTIKDVTRPVVIDFEFDGVATDPFGNERVGLSGKVVVNRKDFGLEWNAALETGGVLVSENVTLTFEISAIKTPESTDGDVAQAEAVEANAAAGDVVEDVVAEEPVAGQAAQARVEEPVRAASTEKKGGFGAWLKRLFG